MNYAKPTEEWQFLHYCCQLVIQKEAPDIQLKSNSINWEKLLELATRHRVIPLLYRGLIKYDNHSQFFPELYEKLKAINIRIITFNFEQIKELIELVKLFRAENIEIIPFKGPILAKEAFGDLGARNFSDLDFLFNISDLENIKNILRKRNYTPEFNIPRQFESLFIQQNCEYNFNLFKNTKRLFHIEPHWTVGKKLLQLNISYTELRSLSSSKEIFGTSMNLLTLEGQLIVCCLHHGGKEHWVFLKHICDIAAILKKNPSKIDWEIVLKKSEKWKVTNIVLIGVGLASELFNINLPDSINGLVGTNKIQKHIKHFIIQQQNPLLNKRSAEFVIQRFWFSLRLRKYWSTRVKICYYHFLQLFLPLVEKMEDKEYSRIDYLLLILSKPLQLRKRYNINKSTKP